MKRNDAQKKMKFKSKDFCMQNSFYGYNRKNIENLQNLRIIFALEDLPEVITKALKACTLRISF